MLESKASPRTASSEKDRPHEKKNFNIPISNGIFEHYSRLKDAVWLLSLFVDWTTKEIEVSDGSRDGLVWGGKPIRDEDVASAFHGQICTRTARRWRQRLARLGYIAQKRTPVGYVIRVKKSKKLAHLDTSSPKVIGQECPIRSDKSVRSNKDFAVDSTLQDKDEAVEATAAAAAKAVLQRQEEEHWKDIGILPTGSRAFQEMWKATYDQSRGGEEFIDIMERCIQACQDSGVKVPPPFFDAKRALERVSTSDGKQLTGLPKLEPIRRDSPEPFRRDWPEIERMMRTSEPSGHLAWQLRREQERREQSMERGLPDDDRLPPIPDLGR